MFRQLVFYTVDFFKGKKVIDHLKDIEQHYKGNIFSNREDIIVKLLKHASSSTEFYRDFKGLSIKDFPVINKKIIRDNFNDFKSNVFQNEDTFEVVTSGSTGLPFKTLQNLEKKKRNTADTIFFAKKGNFLFGNLLVYLKIWNNINSKTRLERFKENIFPVNVLNLSDKEKEKIINTLNKKNKINILGYVSAIEELAKYIYNNKIITKFTVDSIITMSEGLSKSSRVYISKAFKTNNVYSRYSNVENGIIAQQIDHTGEFLVNTASYYVEILDFSSNLPVKKGEVGRIVITDYFNYAMPIIRYDTGDIGSLNLKEGKIFLSSIGGRKMDIIYNTRGELLSSFVVTNSMWNYSELLQYQFIQEQEKIYRFKLNVEQEFNREQELIKEFKEYLGQDATIVIEYVNEIPLLASGKRKKVMNTWLN